MTTADKKTMAELRSFIQYRNGEKSVKNDLVVKEIPLTVMLNDSELATLICSPYAHKELVLGFLVGEGFLLNPEDIKDYYYREEQGVIWVETYSPTPADKLEKFLCRNFTSCCGKGRPAMYFINDLRQVKPVTGMTRFTVDQILKLVHYMEEESYTYKLTGGVHSAVLADQEHIIIRFEDIGRHNALDRIMGYSFLNRIYTADKAVILSGRISSEMVIKAARIGTPIVISKSAPTVLALDLAEQLGLTVVGFVRGQNLNIYSHIERITD